MQPHRIVSHDEWLAARKAFLVQEKQFTRARDDLSRQRRELPWVRVEKDYVFGGPDGTHTLADLFGGKNQLIIQHFMFHPDWNDACKSCSFWADGYDRAVVHLAARDTAMAAVSRAPVAKIEAFKKRMGWTFPWLSEGANGFGHDFGVAFTPDEIASGQPLYNFGTQRFGIEDAPGISVFYRNDAGDLFHTYSCYARGLDMMNVAYQYLDLTPQGRQERDLSPRMSWVRLRDRYGT
jgi:predicted dithiol-disulfide oxidoreductase (DUF899 family)